MKKENTTKNIVIIGNGFDMHHGMHTSFKDFVNSKMFDNSENKYLLERMKKEAILFRMNDSKVNDIKKYKNYIQENQIESNWYDLETILRDSMLYEYNNNDKNFQSIDFNKVINKWKELLRIYLKNQENLITKKSSKIESIVKKANLIINFNYTNTLEKIYGIDSSKINYIHGKSNENFVFGYSPFYTDDNYRDNDDRLNSIITSQNNELHAEEYDLKMLSPIKEIQRFILWLSRHKEFKSITTKDIINLFIFHPSEISENFDPNDHSQHDRIMLRNTLMSYNPLSSDEISLLEQNLKNLKNTAIKKAILKYGKECLKLGDESHQNVRITIIGHNFKSDINLKKYLANALLSDSEHRFGGIAITYYDYISDEEEGTPLIEEKHRKIRKSLLQQFDLINENNIPIKDIARLYLDQSIEKRLEN